MSNDDTKKAINTLRLLIGAAEAEAAQKEIDEMFVPQIAEARVQLGMMRGADVLDAVLACQRSGLSLSRDVFKRIQRRDENGARTYSDRRTGNPSSGRW